MANVFELTTAFDAIGWIQFTKYSMFDTRMPTLAM